jgi:hypothetical protein
MSYVTSTSPVEHLSTDEAAKLRCVAGYMIPASDEYGVPGADDELIFANIASTLGRDADAVRKGLERLDELSDGSFASLAAEARNIALMRLAVSEMPLLAALVTVITRGYYRDDRVMRSLNMEVRPPFPRGFEVEQGDWSLLDPVRARGRIWRDAP